MEDENKDITVPTDIEEIFIQRANEDIRPLKGQELFDETMKLLNEYIEQRDAEE